LGPHTPESLEVLWINFCVHFHLPIL